MSEIPVDVDGHGFSVQSENPETTVSFKVVSS